MRLFVVIFIHCVVTIVKSSTGAWGDSSTMKHHNFMFIIKSTTHLKTSLGTLDQL